MQAYVKRCINNYYKLFIFLPAIHGDIPDITFYAGGYGSGMALKIRGIFPENR